MPRTITPALDAELSQVVTKPVFLIELDWSGSGGTLFRFSTYGDVTWKTNVYAGGVASLLDLENAVQGSVTQATVRIPTVEQAMLAYLLANDWRFAEARVWMTYAEAYADDDPVMLIDGRINGTRADKTDLSIYLLSQTSLSSRSPRVLCAPPLMNCLPPDGTTFVWSGGSLTINRR